MLFFLIALLPPFDITTGKDAGDKVEHISGADIAVAVVGNHSLFDNVYLFLGFLVNDAGNKTGELDGVLLVFKKFHFQSAMQPLVGLIVKDLATNGQSADVVHNLASEIIFAVIRNVNFLFN